jgi:tetratricopeptide (TPR) repeat protein
VRPVVESLLPKAEAAARHAIQLDPKNADGYFALGYVLYSRGSFTMANNIFMQGFALDANNPDGLHFYSGMLADLGYLKAALAMRERLQALEPLAQIFRTVSSRILLAAGRPDATLAMAGENSTAVTRAPIYAFQGRYAEAADLLQTIPDGAFLPGSAETAAKLLRTAPSPAPSPNALPKLGGFGFIYLYVGAPDRVLDWL